jgi:L-fuculose-phosphate aldolase
VREQLVAACSELQDLVLGSSGNVSVREGDRVAVTRSGASFDSMTVDDTSVVDLSGDLVEGHDKPTSELQLHLAVYERFGEGAVVHTHAPMATAVSCVVDEVPAVHYGMLAFGGSLRVAPYATFGTAELAANVLAALDGRSSALMQNHGAVSFGGSLRGAVEAARLVEWACGIYWRARAIGEPSALSEAQLADVAAQIERLEYGQ